MHKMATDTQKAYRFKHQDIENNKPEDTKPLQFSDKFDCSDDPTDTRGMNVLTTVGCMNRHNITRDEMMKTPQENKIANLESLGHIEYEEKQLCNKVATYLKQGYKLRPEETLEEFVERVEIDNYENMYKGAHHEHK